MATQEASQADYRAVLAAVNALGADHREHAIGLGALNTELAAVKTELATVKTGLADFRMETRASFRSVDERLAEIKDLLVGRRNGS